MPRIQVILRKAFGGAYIVMDYKPLGADLCLAWPSDGVAVIGAEAAANVIFKREIAGADEPDARRSELTEQYVEACMHPYAAAELGLVDDVINPRDTRQVLVQALAMLRSKRGSSRPESTARCRCSSHRNLGKRCGRRCPRPLATTSC